MKSNYYDYYMAKAPATVQELNKRKLRVVRYFEGINEFYEYQYRWRSMDISMTELVNKAYKENTWPKEWAGLQGYCDRLRGIAQLYRDEEANAKKEHRSLYRTPAMKKAWADFLSDVERDHQRRIDWHPIHKALRQSDYILEQELKRSTSDIQCRYEEIKRCDTKGAVRPLEEYDALSDSERAVLLAKAADYGITPQETTLNLKDVYNLVVRPVVEPAELPTALGGVGLYWLRPFNVYDKPDIRDVIKNIPENYTTIAGRFRWKGILRGEENIAMAYADLYESEYGDDLLEETTSTVYQVLDADTKEVLYQGTGEECEARRKYYEAEGPVLIVATLVPASRRDIRLGLAEEDILTEYKDFLAPLHEDESEMEDESTWQEDVLDDNSEDTTYNEELSAILGDDEEDEEE